MRKINKRGSIGDLFLIIVIMLVVGMMTILAVKIFDGFKAEKDTIWGGTDHVNNTFTQVENGLTTTDNMMLFFFIGTCIVMLVLASVVPANPTFFVIALILFIIAIAVSIVASNIYEQFESQDSFSGNSISLPKMSFIMDKLPFFIAGMGFIVMIILFGRGALG